MEGDIGGDLELVGEPFPFLDVELCWRDMDCLSKAKTEDSVHRQLLGFFFIPIFLNCSCRLFPNVENPMYGDIVRSLCIISFPIPKPLS